MGIEFEPSGCRYDSLEISFGMSNIPKQCGEELKEIESPLAATGSVTIKFVSDRSSNGAGFRITFSGKFLLLKLN